MSALDNAKAALGAIGDSGSYGDGGLDSRVLEIVEGGLAALIAEHERVLAEMHQRELHHFETEKLLVEAGIDPDAERVAPQEWEYGVRHFGWPPARVHSSRERAELDLGTCGMSCYLVHRPVGAWEPLPEDTNQTNERSER